jgi:hypothetical protein
VEAATVLFDRKGRVRADHVRVNRQDEAHPEGSYFIEWWDHGKRRREAAGPDSLSVLDFSPLPSVSGSRQKAQ